MAGGKGIKKGSTSDVYACSVQSRLVLNVYSIAGHPLKRIAEGIKDPPSGSILWLEATWMDDAETLFPIGSLALVRWRYWSKR